jgi:hypothetical protein
MGLIASTLSVHVTSAVTAASGRLVHTAAVAGANLCSYGALWLLQFVLCDRILFKTGAPAPVPAAAEKSHAAPADSPPALSLPPVGAQTPGTS